MESWPHVPVPSLSEFGLGYGPALHLYDVWSQQVIAVDPEAEARMYVCGITPYDATHIGHAATYVAFDLVQRVWRDHGIDVNYTQNVTDVDDPLLARAAATGIDWRELAQSQTDLFRHDMQALRVVPPTHFYGAVETIDRVIDLISELQAAGAVYWVDNDLYFRVRHDRQFGTLSKYGAAEMLEIFGERGGDPERPGKDDPFDCLLWKAEVSGEPAWDSPLGRGRPGWHIECAAIALDNLGANFDLQGGGSDLVFPHHEMSASQGRVATGQEFAQAFMHTGMVALDGEKMSKSKGNLELVSRLREIGVDPMAVRLAIVANRYRSDWEWSDSILADAQTRLDRWRSAMQRESAAPAGPVVDALRDALAHDLDTPTALAIIDRWVAAEGDDTQAPAAIRTAVDALLGIE